MRILLTGANGFIGRYLLARLLAAGHTVIPAVRDPAQTDRLLPAPASVRVNFNMDVTSKDWLPRLRGIDAVINCAGILNARPGQSIEAIHAKAPIALFTACREAGVKRVIQISAISAEPAAGTDYALTKRAADEFLASTDLDWIILRPSLVYASGAFGGTALLRALAALPWITPVVEKGEQLFQPIHVDDVSATVLRILDDTGIRRTVIDPVGPDSLTMRQIVVDLRRWLGYPPARIAEIPQGVIDVFARIGDVIGGPVNTTSLRQLLFGNTGDPESYIASTGVHPRRWGDALLAEPAQSQDRWHARMYFLRPLLRWTLATMWVASGLIGLSQPPRVSESILSSVGLPSSAAAAATWLFCAIDLAVGVALVVRWRPGILAVLQVLLVVAYTIGLSISQPELWFDPFGPLLKNLPIIAAALALSAIESDR